MINETTQGRRHIKQFAGAALNGSHHNYMALAHQSEETRQVMQQLAILKRFNASLCNAVFATEDAARIIEQIWAETINYIPESTFIDWLQNSMPIGQQSVCLAQIFKHRRSTSTELAQSELSQTMPVPALQEPLSERELDVLRLLTSDLSGPEISAQLFISINTFRTHTKNLYSKLQVNTRRAVVRRTKELSIL